MAKKKSAKRKAKGYKKAKKSASAAKPQATAAVVAADKPHAVAASVAAQLTSEGRWPPNDLTKVMGTDYRYTQFTMGNFLAGVQRHLAAFVPPFTFVFDGAFTIQALPMTVAPLIVAINARTT